MAVELRPATPDDVEAIQRVASRAWHAAHASIVGTDAVDAFLDDYYDGETLRSMVEDEETILDVAEDAGSVVGFVSASPDEGSPATFGLGRIYVLPDRWGEGIGRRLLARAEEEIARRGGETVRLGVMAENDRAVEFYEAAGYVRRDEFYDDRIETPGYTYEKSVE